MKESICDSNGYPTEDGLRLLSEWNIATEDVSTMLKVLQSMWRSNKSGFVLTGKRVQHLQLHTGNLPGNEEIINALKKNEIFWGRYWRTHRKGGHYYFTIRPMRLLFEGEVISRSRKKWEQKNTRATLHLEYLESKAVS
jgi:hypothetical protein